MDSMAMSKKGRKVMRLANDDKLDEALYQWFVQKRSQDTPVENSCLSASRGRRYPPFQASRGWLGRFCNRHRNRQLSLQGEKVSSDATAVEPFKAELQQLLPPPKCSNYNASHIQPFHLSS